MGVDRLIPTCWQAIWNWVSFQNINRVLSGIIFVSRTLVQVYTDRFTSVSMYSCQKVKVASVPSLSANWALVILPVASFDGQSRQLRVIACPRALWSLPSNQL